MRIFDFVESKISCVTNEDTKSREHLPAHNKRATNRRRRRLSSIDRHRRRLRPDAESEEEARDEHVPPGVCEGLPEASCGGEETCQEDGAAASEPLVEGDGEPAADEGAAEVGGGVEEADEPGGAGVLAADTEMLFVEDLGAVDDCLVHSLYGGTERAEEDDEIQFPWLPPLMLNLIGEDLLLLIGHPFHFGKPVRVLRDHSAETESANVLLRAEGVLAAVLLAHIGHALHAEAAKGVS
jgi:hypothetical protein